MNHRQARKVMDRLFKAQALGPEELNGLRDHLAECPACAGMYSRYALLEDSLCGFPEDGTVFARERVMQSVLARVCEGDEKRKSHGLSKRRLAYGAAGLLAAAGVLMVLLPSRHELGERVDIPAGLHLVEVGVSAKGGRSGVISELSRVGIRMFRVQAKGSVKEAYEPLDLSDVVTFTYTNLDKQAGYLALFGLQGELEFRWYYPGYSEDTSIRIQEDVVDEPLGQGIRLSVNHEPGSLLVVALFSKRPLHKAEMEKAVRSRMEQGMNLEGICPLDIESTLSHCIMSDISKRF